MICSRCFHNGRICVIIDVNRSAVERCIGTLSVFGALLVRTERVFQRLPVLSMASWEVIVPLRWSPGPVPIKARGTGVLSAKCSFLARGAISWTPQRTCLGLKERHHIVGRCCKARMPIWCQVAVAVSSPQGVRTSNQTNSFTVCPIHALLESISYFLYAQPRGTVELCIYLLFNAPFGGGFQFWPFVVDIDTHSLNPRNGLPGVYDLA